MSFQESKRIEEQRKEDQRNFEEWRDGCIVKVIVYPILAAIFITLLVAVVQLDRDYKKEIVKEAIEESKQKQ